jgi:hypothetical protein
MKPGALTPAAAVLIKTRNGQAGRTAPVPSPQTTLLRTAPSLGECAPQLRGVAKTHNQAGAAAGAYAQ